MTKKIAYLSPEFALSGELPVYAGGLGVLAADILRQAADSGFPLVGVTLFYPEGCFDQRVDKEGTLTEEYRKLDPKKAGLVETGVTVAVPFPDREVHLKVRKKEIGEAVLYLLDADIPENSERDRTMAYRLYDGRVWPPHIERDALLGVGGVRALRALGEDIAIWHINDDHTSFSLLERIRELVAEGQSLASARAKVKGKTVFTTHTPDPGAESAFTLEETKPFLAALFRGLPVSLEKLCELGAREIEGQRLFSLTVFSLRHSRFINAVSRAHRGIARKLWSFVWPDLSPDKVPIEYITNGVYPPRWVAQPLASLYGKYLSSDWRGRTDDPSLWGKVRGIPDEVFWQARLSAKERLAAEVFRRTGKKIDPNALILGFARRFVPYKQPALAIFDLSRLASILSNPKQPVYLLMAGKAHPRDVQAKELVKAVVEASRDPALDGRLIFLENYGLDLARLLVSGSDVWLNTPIPGREACGTSGMKALYNGVLQASTLGGWWVEGFNGRNGWVIDSLTGSPQGGPDGVHAERSRSAASLYKLLEDEIVPLYYNHAGETPPRNTSPRKHLRGVPQVRPHLGGGGIGEVGDLAGVGEGAEEAGFSSAWLKKVKDAIAMTAPRFTTARMLKEYMERPYLHN